MMRSVCATITGLVLALGGCVTSHGPYEPQSEAARDSIKAQALTQKAAGLMSKDPLKAESLLREALTADLFYAPAHNDLGVLFLKKSMLYEAAGEFEWARKLSPSHPDPRLNLALTLERAGRIDEALSTYASALEVYPEHMPTIQALTRLRIRSGRPDDKTRSMLEEIALKGETAQWREWARGQMAKSVP